MPSAPREYTSDGNISEREPRKGTETFFLYAVQPRNVERISEREPRKGTETRSFYIPLRLIPSYFRTQTPKGDGLGDDSF